ncbi:hypothetical protein HDU83_007049 [Entophlyctis luteolus]|nr:hypothetical protein HDU83_007049 [Entophlyctis luteolus]
MGTTAYTSQFSQTPPMHTAGNSSTATTPSKRTSRSSTPGLATAQPPVNLPLSMPPPPPPPQGMIPRALQQIFALLESRGGSAGADVRVSFLELHNEEWVDLLGGKPVSCSAGSSTTIAVREDKDGRITVCGATTVSVESAADAVRILAKGARLRATAATSMNETSSRSHAVFSVTLSSTSSVMRPATAPASLSRRFAKDTASSTLRITSKFHFVDLAGSERLKRTQNTGERKAEGISINQGLLVLGRVINSLTEGKCGANGTSNTQEPATVVPYRDSKLTRFLQDSLGGNSKTVMLACISPVESNLSETVNTLRYAARARGIQNKSRITVESASAHSSVEITALLHEISTLKSLLAAATAAEPPQKGSEDLKADSDGSLAKECTAVGFLESAREQQLEAQLRLEQAQHSETKLRQVEAEAASAEHERLARQWEAVAARNGVDAAALEQKLEACTARNEELARLCALHQEDSRVLTERVDALRACESASSADAAARISDLQNALACTENEKVALKSEIAVLEGKLSQLQEQISEISLRSRVLESQADCDLEENCRLREKLERECQQNQDLKMQIERTARDLKNVQATHELELKTKAELLIELETKVANSENKAVNLQHEVFTREDYDEVKCKLAAATAQSQRRQKLLSSMHTTLKSRLQDLVQAKRDIKLLTENSRLSSNQAKCATTDYAKYDATHIPMECSAGGRQCTDALKGCFDEMQTRLAASVAGAEANGKSENKTDDALRERYTTLLDAVRKVKAKTK